MQSIRAGDLYFLKSPINSEYHDTVQEKKLSYLLGTVSARPAVVIRPPMWWDPYSTVTVIPALSDGDPALVLTLQDRYGRQCRSDYPLTPYTPHSIPVSRLGRYIGSLDPDELEELLYAFKWIHDPFMQADPNCKVPAIFEKVVSQKVPKGSWISQRDGRANVLLQIKKDGTLASDTHPDMNGMVITEKIHDGVPYHVMKTVEDEPNYVAAETVLPDAEPHGANEKVVPVEKSFPESLYDQDTLQRIAGRFDISSVYYEGKKKKYSPYLLNPHELNGIRGDLSDSSLEEVLAYYSTMTPFDANILGTRLPTPVLTDITGLGTERALVLKSLCNYMRGLLQVDLELREKEFTARMEAEKKQKVEETQNDEPAPDYKTYLQRVKPYLNAKGISRMPSEVAELFLQIPMGMIKRAYSGTQFDAKYTDAVRLYKEMKKGA